MHDDVAVADSPAHPIPLSIGCADDAPGGGWGAPAHGALALSGGRFSLLTAFRHSSPSVPNAYTFCLAPSGGEVVLGAREAGTSRDRASATARIRGGGVANDNPLPALHFLGLVVGGDADDAAERFAQTPALDKPASPSHLADGARYPALPRPPRAVRVRDSVPLDAPPTTAGAAGEPASLITTWPHTFPALVDTASSLAHLPAAVVQDAANQLLDACGDDCQAGSVALPALSLRGHPLDGAVSVPCVRVEGPRNASQDVARGNGSTCSGYDAGGFVRRVHLVAEEVTWTVPARQLAFASAPQPSGPGSGPQRCAQHVCLAVTAAMPRGGDAVLGAAALQNFAVSIDHLTGTATFRVSRCTVEAAPCPACGVMGTRWMPPVLTVLAVAAAILAFATCFTFAVAFVARGGALASKRAAVHRRAVQLVPARLRRRGVGWSAADAQGGDSADARIRLAAEGKEEDIESTFSSIRTPVDGVPLDRESPDISTDPPSAASQQQRQQPDTDDKVRASGVERGGWDSEADDTESEGAGQPLVVAHTGTAVVGDVDTAGGH